MRALAAICMALLATGCGGGGEAAKEAEQAPGVASAADGVAPCSILPADKVSTLFGASLVDAPADSLPQAQSCQFADAKGDVHVFLSVVPSDYYEEHKGQDFRKLPGIGDDASMGFELGGWRATAKAGPKAVVVMTDGEHATQDNTIAIMTAALQAGG